MSNKISGCHVFIYEMERPLHSYIYFNNIVGEHKKMIEIYELINEIADSDATVLIMGETGTGKEGIANAIVQHSSRREKPYIKINCTAFPETLLESELFGYVKGAFTDARQDRIGRFELANHGTVFLDEVGEFGPTVQVKLLRVLEEMEFERLGSSETIKVNVRVIAATNQHLPRLVQEKRFREDLFYRLHVIPILLPPLRERRSDIPLLINHFINKYRLQTRKNITEISQQALAFLMSYDYPGNVRELENAIEYAFARTHTGIITEQKLPRTICQFTCDSGSPNNFNQSNLEREEISNALEKAHWNRRDAARLLGISRITLWRRMKAMKMMEKT